MAGDGAMLAEGPEAKGKGSKRRIKRDGGGPLEASIRGKVSKVACTGFPIGRQRVAGIQKEKRRPPLLAHGHPFNAEGGVRTGRTAEKAGKSASDSENAFRQESE